MKAFIILFAALFCAVTVYATSEDCLASAGYSWCAFEGKCVRPWELAKEQGLENTKENIDQYCNLKKNTTAPHPTSHKPQEGPDSQGCYTSAGYAWCDRENKCVRPWELATEKGIAIDTPKAFHNYCSIQADIHPIDPTLPQPTNGGIGSKDDHGCILSAGYSWCSKENKCIRPWELSSQVGIASTPESINAYCASCSVSAGYSWCQRELKCVRPWELATLKNIANTPEAFTTYCSSSATSHPVMGGGSDSHGCIAMAGYTWCQTENKCIRPWELSKEKNFANSRQAVQDYCSGAVTQAPEVHIQRSAIGGESDTHGCVAGAGYSWCTKENACVRPWELASTKNIANTPSAFQSYCENPVIGNVDANGCAAGSGYSWCIREQKCVRPWELAKEKNIANTPGSFESYCAGGIGGAAGVHGCVAGAGYTWCAKENACVRPWELATQNKFENTVEGFQQYCSS